MRPLSPEISPNAAMPAENQMSWRALARFVAGIHIAYVVFVVFGAVIGLVTGLTVVGLPRLDRARVRVDDGREAGER